MQKSGLSPMPLIISGMVGLCLAGLGVYDAWRANAASATPWVISRIEMFCGLAFIAWPFLMQLRQAALVRFPDAIREVTRAMADLEALRREYFKIRNGIDETRDALRQDLTRLGAASELQKQASQLLDRLNTEMELRQQLGNAERRIEEWVRCCCTYCHSLESALSGEELAPTYRAAYEKALKDFSRAMRSQALEVILPERGEPFDDRLHAASQSESDDMLPEWNITRCEAWGFRLGDRVLEKAKVAVAMPATESQSLSQCAESECPCSKEIEK